MTTQPGDLDPDEPYQRTVDTDAFIEAVEAASEEGNEDDDEYDAQNVSIDR